jgi:hypothetical protein
MSSVNLANISTANVDAQTCISTIQRTIQANGGDPNHFETLAGTLSGTWKHIAELVDTLLEDNSGPTLKAISLRKALQAGLQEFKDDIALYCYGGRYDKGDRKPTLSGLEHRRWF